MFVYLLCCMFLGIFFGTITGLVPGLHPNTVFMSMLSFMPMLMFLPPECAVTFIVSLAVTNTFTDFIPSLIFGAPDPSTALFVLPGHRMLLSGRGYEALYLTIIGGISVSTLSLFTLPLLMQIIPFLYGIISEYMHFILIAVASLIILSERGRSRMYAFMIFLFVGIFGVITLSSAGSDKMLFPALSGMFGMSSMFTSLLGNTRIPPQQVTENVKCNYVKGTAASWLSGLLVGLLPGVGSSHAGIISSYIFHNKIKENLMSLGGINTANMLFTLVVLYCVGKTRSGAAWIISQMSQEIAYGDIWVVVLVCVIASYISAVITLKVGKFFILRASVLPYRGMLVCVMGFITFLVSITTGLMGLMVLFTCFFIGLFSILMGLRRTHLMGFLMLPTILYFSGVNVALLNMLGL